MNFKALFKVVGEIIKDHAPEICAVAGTGLMIGGAVLAAKGTLAIDEVLDEHKENMEKINKGVEDDLVSKDGVHYRDLATQDKALTWKKTILGFTKAYGPALACEVGGALLVFSGFKCLRKRNLALAGALTSVTEAFNKYRSRVIAEEGKLTDIYYRTGKKANEEKTDCYTTEDGDKVVPVMDDDCDPNEFGVYSYCFDEANSPKNFSKKRSDNLFFVTCQEKWCNAQLEEYGYLFLNEALRALGLPEVEIGQDVGWIFDKNNDYKIDFGIAEFIREHAEHLDDENDSAFWLEMNCDGYIRDKIWKASREARKAGKKC
jgi:hypothetical protein